MWNSVQGRFVDFSGGSFVLDSVRIFMWFTIKEEPIMQIAEVDRALFEFSEKDFAFFIEKQINFLKVM
jgi:hypothetical protein